MAVIATVTGATITLYEAYEKYYVRPAQEFELSRLKDENTQLKHQLDLLKQQNAQLQQERDSEPHSHPNGAELSKKRDQIGVTRKSTASSAHLAEKKDEATDKDKAVEDAR